MVIALKENQQPSLAVLIACHNRKDKTVECLRRLIESAKIAELNFVLYLFDDGSTDGTAEAVKHILPPTKILHGDGSSFWNRSMHAAFDEALRNKHEHYLWLNDDTMLSSNAISSLLETSRSDIAAYDRASIVVGAICDPVSGLLTYGGGRRLNPTLRPFLYQLLVPNGVGQEVDVINGNVVLIPHSIAESLGNLDPVFEHGMGDTDYSLRARKKNYRIVLTPEYVGTCSRNSVKGTFHDDTASISTRLKFAFSRKGLPWRSWFTLCIRHGGVFWPLHFCWGYLRIILSARPN